MTSNFIVLLGSDPKSGKGGAARVVASYQDYYSRNNISYVFKPFHRMYKLRLFRALPILNLFRYALSLFGKKNYFVHHHHTSLFDLLWLKIFCLLSHTSRERVIITFHNPKHFGDFSSALRKVHFFCCAIIAANLHFLNSRDMGLFESSQSYIFPSHKKVCPNPLESSLLNKCLRSLSADNNNNNTELAPLAKLEVVIGILSVLRFGKRVDLTIKMLSLLPPWFRLRVAGTGEALTSLEALTRELNLSERVEFIGWISDADKPAFFDSISIFVNSSGFDTQSLVVVESIAYGVPVVSVPNPIFLENYPPGVCVDYAKSSSPKALADAVKKFDPHCFDPTEPIKYLLSTERRLNFVPSSFK